ncbi:MAG: hypothetical protein JF590_08730 [Gemmatimonadetes bacterium]|nr:hypothetical protein [Gemmatimonadota bacterium]
MSATIHERLSDRMPEVARGDSSWDGADAEHLAGCAECRAEWEVVRAAAGLGAEVERRFDGAGTSRAVMRRLRREHPLHRRPLVRAAVGLAAAAALALVVTRGAPERSPAPAPAVAAAPLLPELDSLNVEELALLADAVEPPLTESPLGDEPSLTELDTTQLTRILRSLEG